MALTEDRLTDKCSSHVVPELLYLPVKSGVKIYAGSIVVIQSGYAKPGVTGTGLIAVGRAESQVDNTSGSDGDVYVTVRPGVYKYANGSTSITQAHVGTDCYIVDDATVHQTDGTGTRSLAGRIIFVDSTGVQVLLGVTGPAVPASTLLQGGAATLAAGTVTVSGVTLTASSRIVAFRKTPAGTISTAGLDAPSASRNTGAGTFVINAIDADKSTSGADTSTVDYIIFG